MNIISLKAYIANRVQYPHNYQMQVLWGLSDIIKTADIFRNHWALLTLIKETLIHDVILRKVWTKKSYTPEEAAKTFIPMVLDFMWKCESTIKAEEKKDEIFTQIKRGNGIFDKL